MSSKTTNFGFKWEEDGIRLVVQRSFCDKNHMALTIYTDNGAIHVAVTPKGFIRTFIKPKKKISAEYLKSILDQ